MPSAQRRTGKRTPFQSPSQLLPCLLRFLRQLPPPPSHRLRARPQQPGDPARRLARRQGRNAIMIQHPPPPRKGENERSFPRCHLPLSRFFRECGPCHPPPAPRTGMQMLTGGQGHYGNVDPERQVMGKNRERVRSCFSPRLKPPRQTRGRPQFIAAERITPRAATAFKIYYAVKSHLAAVRRCGASRRHAGGPRLSRPYPRRARSEVKSRGVMREGRACRGRTRAESPSEVKSRGVMREGRACRGRTRAGPVPK